LWHLAGNVYGTIINLGHGESGGSASVMGCSLLWHRLPYHIHSVDAFKEVIYNRCVRQLKHLGLNNVTIHRESTVDAGMRWLANNSNFDLTFIDASHEYEDVKNDWLVFSQLSKTVAFHDINQVDVDRVIRECVTDEWKLIHHVDRVKVYSK